ncbi:hypothetical protein BOTBODRAFT_188806 [Botryobasidium botryosum FD-172 SS1]|uniref:Uncharacterized protein n=1 Tax=Botryobasidium botryosum (strain FD-172 SS1) TaxID=930990 RepID=A0A067MBU4_BOTB1|nr:hypothetical protein BOTBODRAFT_188806 [Botryobasidium botryosum FD-172 SS1]
MLFEPSPRVLAARAAELNQTRTGAGATPPQLQPSHHPSHFTPHPNINFASASIVPTSSSQPLVPHTPLLSDMLRDIAALFYLVSHPEFHKDDTDDTDGSDSALLARLEMLQAWASRRISMLETCREYQVPTQRERFLEQYIARGGPAGAGAGPGRRGR